MEIGASSIFAVFEIKNASRYFRTGDSDRPLRKIARRHSDRAAAVHECKAITSYRDFGFGSAQRQPRH